MIKVAPEGHPFILGCLFFTAIVSIIFLWYGKTGNSSFVSFTLFAVTVVSLVLTGFMVFFFRDPDRVVPEGKGVLVSPADGKVIVVRNAYEDTFLDAETKQVSIFMSPLNVHVNRSPCDGKVLSVHYSPGKYMAAYKEEASLQNEHISMVLETEWGNILVRQVAGSVARRAVCRASAGDFLNRGQRYGIIKFSSRLDIFLPKDCTIKVKRGEKVKAGETVIGGFIHD